MSTLRPFFINGKINLRLGDLPLEHKIPPWLPVLLQELKTGLSENSVFGVYHPDAVELYSVCNSLSKVTIMIMWKWNDQISMSWAWDKEKVWVPDRIWTYDLPNTGRALYPLELWRTISWRARPYTQCCQLSQIIRETPDFEPFLRLQIRVWNLLDNCWSLQFLVYATLCRWNFQIIFCVVWAI